MKENMETILLVDDEPVVCSALADVLRKEGYTVLEAGNSEQVLSEVDPDRVDLLISDVSLPGINGCELARRLLGQNSRLKILLMSGYVGAEICRYYAIPVSDIHFLSKPFQAQELLRRVRRVLSSVRPVPGLASVSAAAARATRQTSK